MSLTTIMPRTTIKPKTTIQGIITIYNISTGVERIRSGGARNNCHQMIITLGIDRDESWDKMPDLEINS